MLQKTRCYLAGLICGLFSLCVLLMWSGYTLLSTEAYNEWRVFEVAILCLLSCYYFFIPASFVNYRSIFSVFIIFMLMGGLASSVFNAPFTSRALRDWSLYGGLIFACISLSHVFTQYPKLFKASFICLCVAPLFFIIEFINQAFFYLALPIPDKASVFYTFTAQFYHQRVFADTALPILFMLMALLTATCIKPHKKYQGILYFTLFSLSSIIVFSSGRGALLAIMATTAFFYVLLPQLRHNLRLFLGCQAICFIIGTVLFYTVGDPAAYGGLTRQDSSGRTQIILQSLEYIKHSPFFGIGPAQFKAIVTPVSHPHNVFLQFLMEWGLIAGIAFIGLFASLAITLIKQAKPQQSPFNLFVLLATSAFMINCNFNGAHIYPSSQLYALFVISATLSIYKGSTLTLSNYNASLHNIAKIVQCFIMLVLLWTTYLALGCGNVVTSQKYPFGPRFWSYDSIHSDTECPSASTFFKFNQP